MDNEGQKSMIKFYAKYSTLALQMIIIILISAFGGRKLDFYFEFDFPYFTVSLTLLGVIVSVVYGSRELFRKKTGHNKKRSTPHENDKE